MKPFGDGFLSKLVEISGQSGDVRIHGFVSEPHEHRTNSYGQFYYVSGRVVRDKLMTSAVRQAYLHTMPASAYPVVLLFLELPHDQIDVNVHPAKTEVRFRVQSLIHDLIRETIRRALTGLGSIPAYDHRGPGMPAGAPHMPADGGLGTTPALAGFGDAVPPGPAPDPFERAFGYPLRGSAASAIAWAGRLAIPHQRGRAGCKVFVS